MGHLDIGKRMKFFYEKAYEIKLPMRMPVIVRVDGKKFHTFTRGMKKPFDEVLMFAMNHTAKALCEEMQGSVLAYLQSDEISILLHNYKKHDSSAWFDNKIQKIASVSASMASVYFNNIFHNALQLEKTSYPESLCKRVAFFDSRAFVLPEAEVCNYFIWRQKDWERNSLQMLARSLYSHKELENKNASQLHDLCFEKGKNWNDLPIPLKRGRCVIKREGDWIIDDKIQKFTEDRNYIEDLLATEE